MTEKYHLEKWTWTDEDFNVMGWHDCSIYAIAFQPENYELILDIDYIFAWESPEAGETWVKFWIAPSTLVFENLYNLEFEIASFDGQLQMDGISRDSLAQSQNTASTESNHEWRWTILCHQGEIRFRSSGYKMYIRTSPLFTQQQKVDPDLRKGSSFERRTGE